MSFSKINNIKKTNNNSTNSRTLNKVQCLLYVPHIRLRGHIERSDAHRHRHRRSSTRNKRQCEEHRESDKTTAQRR